MCFLLMWWHQHTDTHSDSLSLCQCATLPLHCTVVCVSVACGRQLTSPPVATPHITKPSVSSSCTAASQRGECVFSHSNTHTHTPRSKSGCGSQPKNQTAEFNTQNQMCEVDAPAPPNPGPPTWQNKWQLPSSTSFLSSSSSSFTTKLHRWNLLRGSAAALMPR